MTDDALHLDAIPVKVPDFWESHLALFLHSLEAQFQLGRVTSDETKFFHLVGGLHPKYLVHVADIIDHPPTDGKYDSVRTRLIARFADSEQKKLNTLLDGMQMGDDKPSHFLSRMRQSAPSAAVGLVKSLWLKRLPPEIQTVLAASSVEEETKLALLADKIMEVVTPSVATVSVAAAPQPDPFSIFTSQVAALSLQVEALNRSCRSSTPERSRGQYRCRSSSGSRFQQQPGGLCYYHFNFQERARNCRQPCSFNNFPPASKNM